jgi:hypothetical protein
MAERRGGGIDFTPPFFICGRISEGDMYPRYVSPFLIRHLELSFASEKLPPAHIRKQVTLMEADLTPGLTLTVP